MPAAVPVLMILVQKEAAVLVKAVLVCGGSNHGSCAG